MHTDGLGLGAVVDADLLPVGTSAQQMYAGNIAILAEKILDPTSTGGSGLSSSMCVRVRAAF